MNRAQKWQQLSFEEESVNVVRTQMQTLIRYLQTSMALHGYLTTSARVHGASVRNLVLAVGEANPESGEVQRWVRKFEEFYGQSGLNGTE